MFIRNPIKNFVLNQTKNKEVDCLGVAQFCTPLTQKRFKIGQLCKKM